MVAGPLLVSLVVAAAGATTAIVVSAAVIGVAGSCFAVTHAVRTHLPPPSSWKTGRLRLAGGLLTLLFANFALGFVAGARGVSLPAAAIAQGAPLLAGIGFAIISIGDLVGGLAYGTIRWRASRSRQLTVSLLLTAVVSWLAVPSSESVAVLFPILLVSGVLGACVPICMSALLDDVTSPASLTSAYTSMVSLSLVASAAGNASAGIVIEHGGPATGFAVAAGAATVAFLWTMLRRSLWGKTAD